MRDMLNRLAKADPETMWEIDYYAPDNLDIRQYEHHGIEDRFTLDAIIQAVLQGTITSRGWLWTLSAEDKGHPTGAPYTCHLWDGDINEMVMDISGGSPAGALLAAYLAAIEVQA